MATFISPLPIFNKKLSFTNRWQLMLSESMLNRNLGWPITCVESNYCAENNQGTYSGITCFCHVMWMQTFIISLIVNTKIFTVWVFLWPTAALSKNADMRSWLRIIGCKQGTGVMKQVGRIRSYHYPSFFRRTPPTLKSLDIFCHLKGGWTKFEVEHMCDITNPSV